MARLNIDTGTAGNTATGDTIRTAMTKVNTNFVELFGVHADTGLITTSLTNGDIRIQPNGTGTIEIDQLQVDSSAITTTATNSNLTLTANGTGAVSIDTIKVLIPNLPTSDPGVAGQVWRSSNDLKISTG
jgi:hypothetical protein